MKARAILFTGEQAKLLEIALYTAWHYADTKAGGIVKDGGEHKRQANKIYALYEHVRHDYAERIPKTAFTEEGWSFRPSAYMGSDGKPTGEKNWHIYKLRDRTFESGSIEQNGPAWITHRIGTRPRAFLTFVEAKAHILKLLEGKAL